MISRELPSFGKKVVQKAVSSNYANSAQKVISKVMAKGKMSTKNERRKTQ